LFLNALSDVLQRDQRTEVTGDPELENTVMRADKMMSDAVEFAYQVRGVYDFTPSFVHENEGVLVMDPAGAGETRYVLPMAVIYSHCRCLQVGSGFAQLDSLRAKHNDMSMSVNSSVPSY